MKVKRLTDLVLSTPCCGQEPPRYCWLIRSSSEAFELASPTTFDSQVEAREAGQLELECMLDDARPNRN